MALVPLEWAHYMIDSAHGHCLNWAHHIAGLDLEEAHAYAQWYVTTFDIESVDSPSHRVAYAQWKISQER